ncbi:MAG: porin [Gemmatimonadetes bacterium]|nr:porin [Gemmatimonadota bacterium]
MTRVFVPAVALAIASISGSSAMAQATADTAVTVKFGGFVDGYYAYDFNRPRTLDRAFSTQPARHNEFNINLAHVEAVLSGARVRGRLAVQFGTSVQSNYAAEPRVGSYSGGDVSRYIQEAAVGVKLTPRLWLDGGIYLSHIGSESWISRDNLTYTRSLIADYSPYYQSGVKLTWQATPSLTAQVNVVNGWQNISETNRHKAIGGRLDWAASPKVTLSAYNLIGNETPDSVDAQLRIFQGGSVKLVANDKLTLMGTFDFGMQDLVAETGRWYGTSLIARVQATSTTALVARVERYADPKQVIIVTGGADAFKANGGSFGVDVTPAPKVLWRTELRALAGSNAVFPRRDGTAKSNAFIVSSLALTF